jgi:glycosyltransferase involved in cell wall biosynthesis
MNLAVLLTRNTSLDNWMDNGSLKRELAVYVELIKNKYVDNIYLLNNGSCSDITQEYIHKESKNFKIISIQNKYPLTNIFEWLFLIKSLKKIDLFISNQLDGSFVILMLSVILKKKFIYRSGYSLVEFLKRDKKFLKYIYYLVYEKIICILATKIIVTSNKHSVLLKRFKKKVLKINNYVDESVFNNCDDNIRTNDILWVGRYEKQKNIINLSHALNEIKEVKVKFIGEGSLKKVVSHIINDNSGFSLEGRLSSKDLAQQMRSSKIFVLPSLYEGNPKILIEAMASGCLVIASKGEGISDLVSEKEVIFIDGFSSDSIKDAIVYGLKFYCDNYYRIQNSKKWINNNATLSSYVELYNKAIS